MLASISTRLGSARLVRACAASALALAATSCARAPIVRPAPASLPSPVGDPEQLPDLEAVVAAASSFRDVPLGIPVLAIHQENRVLGDPDFNRERFSTREARSFGSDDAAGLTRLVGARYVLDGVELSARSSLEVYPELDEYFHRPAPSEWYYTRKKKDETLPRERTSLVWSGAIAPGEHVLVVELVHTLPRCCYAGCFPKVLVTRRSERRFRADASSAQVVQIVWGATKYSLTTPVEERTALRIADRVFTRTQALVPRDAVESSGL